MKLRRNTKAIIIRNTVVDKKLLLSVLNDIKLDVDSAACLSYMIGTLTDLLPEMLSKYIFSSDTKVNIDKLKSFSLTEGEKKKILSSIQASLLTEKKLGVIKVSICDLFIEEKLAVLGQYLGYSFAHSLANNLIEYTKNNKKKKNMTEQGYVLGFLLNDPEFRNDVKALCLAILQPPLFLLNLVILMKPESFEAGLKNGDFIRMTVTRLSDAMCNAGSTLSEEEIERVCSELYKRHKYIFYCHNFSEIIKPFCIAIKSLQNDLESAFKTCFDEFRKAEVDIVSKSSKRLAAGLIKWVEQEEDLVGPFRCALERDLFSMQNKRDNLEILKKRDLIEVEEPKHNVKRLSSSASMPIINHSTKLTGTQSNVLEYSMPKTANKEVVIAK